MTNWSCDGLNLLEWFFNIEEYHGSFRQQRGVVYQRQWNDHIQPFTLEPGMICTGSCNHYYIVFLKKISSLTVLTWHMKTAF